MNTNTKTGRAVVWLAPIAPPCFGSRDQWIGYLVAAAEATRDAYRTGGTSSPLLYAGTTPIAFNHAFDFCEDCSADYARTAQRLGECRPGHLKALNPAREEEVAA